MQLVTNVAYFLPCKCRKHGTIVSATGREFACRSEYEATLIIKILQMEGGLDEGGLLALREQIGQTTLQKIPLSGSCPNRTRMPRYTKSIPIFEALST